MCKVNMRSMWQLVLLVFFLPAFIMEGRSAWAAPAAAAADQDVAHCQFSEPTSYPKTAISNGLLNAVVYLPSAESGYYRGVRFDWSGVVGCLTYKGHSYFGVWFPHYDPYLDDAISGPVEEFRSSDGSVGYGEAKPNGLFFKPGVGVLRKIDNSPYKFTVNYPLVDGGKWKVRSRRDGVTFTHTLRSNLGYSYVYTKKLSLEKNQPVLILEHQLKNTGSRTIDTDVYDHDFYMLDQTPTGPGIEVKFPFNVQATQPLQNGAKIEGNKIVYERELQPRESATSYLTGFSDRVSDYDITVENTKTGVGVQQTSDSPIAQINFWSIRTTVCPEAYIHLHVLPGETAHWTIRYRFFAK